MVFCKEIGDQLVRRAICDTYVPRLDAVSDEEVADVHVAGLFTAGHPSIVSKEHGTLVVLVNHAVLDLVALCLQEISHPEYLGHAVIHTD